MPNLTTNYGLKKPLANEYIKPDDFNYNADAIDAALKVLDDSKATPQDIADAIAAAANNSNVLTAINITSANYSVHPIDSVLRRATFAIPHNRYLLYGRVNLPDYSSVTQRFIEISMVITKANTLAIGFNRSHAYLTSKAEDIALISGNSFISMIYADNSKYGFVTTSGFYIDTYPDHMPTGTLYYMQI